MLNKIVISKRKRGNPPYHSVEIYLGGEMMDFENIPMVEDILGIYDFLPDWESINYVVFSFLTQFPNIPIENRAYNEEKNRLMLLTGGGH